MRKRAVLMIIMFHSPLCASVPQYPKTIQQKIVFILFIQMLVLLM